MKTVSRAWFLLAFLSWGASLPASAQLTVPSKPGEVTKRNLGDNGGSGASAGASAVTPSPSTVVVRHLAVTPLEAWANLAGKTMEARLLAYSAPAEGERGPIEIIREGKVRFLVKGRKDPIDYPLGQLGETEQVRIQALAKAALKGPPN
jgi:hypothetical protein